MGGTTSGDKAWRTWRMAAGAGQRLDERGARPNPPLAEQTPPIFPVLAARVYAPSTTALGVVERAYLRPSR